MKKRYGLEELTADTILNSFRSSTKRQYQSYLLSFTRFSDKHIWDASPVNLVKFLQSLFESNLGYSALNTARSAISSVHGMFSDSQDLGSHPLVTRFMKGVFTARPSVPCYSETWDPEKVLVYLDRDFSSLGILEISRKLLMMLLLLSGQRLSSISMICTDDISFGNNRMTIFSSSLCKQSRPRFHPAPMVFSTYSAKPNLCIITLMKDYLARTESLRNTERKFLFLTSTPPFRRAKIDTLRNWAKNVMKKAGLESAFAVHSVRGAVTSKCIRKTLPIDTVLKAGGWSTESVFRKHYDLPLMGYSGIDQCILNA